MYRDHSPERPREPLIQTPDASRELPRGSRGAGTLEGRTPVVTTPRAALAQQLDLPRSETRARVAVGDRTYRLRDSEVETLAAVGAFRVADARDVAPAAARDRWHGDLEHLRNQGLIELRTHVLDGERTALVSLTREGQALLEHHRRDDTTGPRQQYYTGVAKPRELTHDAQLYGVYARAAERLQADGARMTRVVLDYELKREYQQFLQAENRGRSSSTGRSSRTADEVRAWAEEHHLPVRDGRVQFPDVRLEYDRPDGERAHEDLELATGHYTGRQMAGTASAGFRLHTSRASRLGGGRARRGSAPFEPPRTQRT